MPNIDNQKPAAQRRPPETCTSIGEEGGLPNYNLPQEGVSRDLIARVGGGDAKSAPFSMLVQEVRSAVVVMRFALSLSLPFDFAVKGLVAIEQHKVSKTR